MQALLGVTGTPATFVLIVAVVLWIVAVVTIMRGAIGLRVILIVAALLVGPGIVNVF